MLACLASVLQLPGNSAQWRHAVLLCSLKWAAHCTARLGDSGHSSNVAQLNRQTVDQAVHFGWLAAMMAMSGQLQLAARVVKCAYLQVAEHQECSSVGPWHLPEQLVAQTVL